jgi:hypothetical protein
MSSIEQFRHGFSSFLLWCIFLALYLGGAALLVMGLTLTGKGWWVAIHQHAGMGSVVGKTALLALLAIGFVLVLVIPLAQFQAIGHLSLWRSERRSGMKS